MPFITFSLVSSSMLCLASGGFIVDRHSAQSIGLPKVQSDDDVPPDEWFSQRLDHFGFGTPHLWEQRYLTNSSFFRNQTYNPIFLMIGGNEKIMGEWVTSGAWIDLAEKHKALCFLLEHRFYGQSQPLGNLSVNSYQYLAISQAVADVAHFVEEMSEKYGLSRNKWVLFGGGYAGALAFWARLKYPHLVHAAVSTSSPVTAVVDYTGYDEVVRQSLNASNQLCLECVHSGALKLQEALQDPEIVKGFKEKFNLCENLDPNSTHDVSVFVELLAYNVRNAALFNKVNRIPIGANKPALSLDDVCGIMTNVSIGGVLERFAALSGLVLGTEKCLDVSYDNGIKEVKEEVISHRSDARSWMFQLCSELGMIVSSSTPDSLFGSLLPPQFFLDQCKYVFGPEFDDERLAENVKRTNSIFGGASVADQVTNVLFVQGSQDPWRLLGVKKSSHGTSLLLIDGAAHCASMYSASSQDPPSLTEARAKIGVFLDLRLTPGVDEVSTGFIASENGIPIAPPADQMIDSPFVHSNGN